MIRSEIDEPEIPSEIAIIGSDDSTGEWSIESCRAMAATGNPTSS